MDEEKRNNYCRNCKRSIWGDSSCDVNVENNGKYVGADDKCYCKCDETGMVEKYSWFGKEERRMTHMAIPKEIVEKMEQVNSLMAEIDKWLDENIDTDGSRHNHRRTFSNEYYHDDYYEFSDEPSGEPQDDGEYCNQSSYGESGDSFYGTYYYPTEKGNYFCFEYWV